MGTTRPAIFTLVECPIIGEFGPNSVITERDSCPTCDIPYMEEVVFLDYQFDTWERAELIKVGRRTYAVTRRLFDVLSRAGIKGLVTKSMKASRSILFSDIDPENKIVVPDFLHLIVAGQADGPSGWWDRGEICKGCKRVAWMGTPRIAQALFANLDGRVGPPRMVSHATWGGEDMFFLTDPGPPVVTENFKRIVEAEKVEGLVMDPAVWVD